VSGVSLRLVGGGGERVDYVRLLNSHGLAELPPMRIDQQARTLSVTLPVGVGRPRTVHVRSGRPGFVEMTVDGRAPSATVLAELQAKVAHILRLDEDLSPFYGMVADDPDLSWVAAAGAGRMIRSATVFEEVVKTVCTTNCAWSATIRMVTALVEHLGERAANAPPGPLGRAFPSPATMAGASDAFYRDVVRAGYRGPYLRSLARSVADGEVDLESLPNEPSDDEVEARLLALPGVGPYAAAHVMLMLGRYSRLILDSWTRPTYAKLVGRRAVKDSAIERRFRRYRPYGGLAFWLYLTRDWVPEA
jgi:3-methyladenine DNA glycosylase/8-oxoguanine DNA glycosylase